MTLSHVRVITSMMLFRYSSCLHYLSHASHAMSDIMLHLSRPPPRQLRARPFVIQSVLQSAVIQSVPVTVGPPPPSASAPASPASTVSQPARPNISTSTVATGPNTRQTTTTFSVSGNSSDPGFERQHAEAMRAARAQHEAQHAAAHTEAVRQAQNRRPITDPFQQIEAILSAHQEMGPDDDFAQVVRNAIGDRDAARDDQQPQPEVPSAATQPPVHVSMPGPGPGVTAHMQPVVVGIELGPDQQPGPGMHGIISSAIQQALRGAGAMPGPGVVNTSVTGSSSNNTTTSSTTTTQGSGNGPQVQVAVGPTMSLPLGPPPPPGMGVGNLNSFDPFLPCSSRHLPSPGGQPRSANTRRQTTRTVRSAPGSRASSMPRLIPASPSPPAPRAGADMLRAMMGGEQGAGVTNDTDQGVLNMIQGVMGQVVGAMGGGAPGAQPTTIRQFLNTLPDYNYVEGESLITDLLMTLAGQLTFQDMVSIVTRNPSPETIGNLQEPMRRFIREKVLNGAEPTEENVKAALLRIADDWFEQLVSCEYLILNVRPLLLSQEESSRHASVRPGVDYPVTVHQFISSRPQGLVMMILQVLCSDQLCAVIYIIRLARLIIRSLSGGCQSW